MGDIHASDSENSPAEDISESDIEDHPELKRGLADANAGRVRPGKLRSDEENAPLRPRE